MSFLVSLTDGQAFNSDKFTLLMATYQCDKICFMFEHTDNKLKFPILMNVGRHESREELMARNMDIIRQVYDDEDDDDDPGIFDMLGEAIDFPCSADDSESEDSEAAEAKLIAELEAEEAEEAGRLSETELETDV